MSDNKNDVGLNDRIRISFEEPYEVSYETEKLRGVLETYRKKRNWINDDTTRRIVKASLKEYHQTHGDNPMRKDLEAWFDKKFPPAA